MLCGNRRNSKHGHDVPRMPFEIVFPTEDPASLGHEIFNPRPNKRDGKAQGLKRAATVGIWVSRLVALYLGWTRPLDGTQLVRLGNPEGHFAALAFTGDEEELCRSNNVAKFRSSHLFNLLPVRITIYWPAENTPISLRALRKLLGADEGPLPVIPRCSTCGVLLTGG